jgi:hypothetical protein
MPCSVMSTTAAHAPKREPRFEVTHRQPFLGERRELAQVD